MTPLLLYVISMIAVGNSFRMMRRRTPFVESCRKQITTLFHQAPTDAPVISAEDQKKIDAFREHQAGAKRLSYGEEVRTLIDQSIGYGVLSTNSVQFEGYPTGSVVGFQVDEQGLPFFVFSTMSAHTTDVLKDDKASLTVMSKDFKGAAEGRVVLVGTVKKVFDAELRGKLRDLYLKRHKDAFWIDFGLLPAFMHPLIDAVPDVSMPSLAFLQGLLLLPNGVARSSALRWRICYGWKCDPCRLQGCTAGSFGGIQWPCLEAYERRSLGLHCCDGKALCWSRLH